MTVCVPTILMIIRSGFLIFVTMMRMSPYSAVSLFLWLPSVRAPLSQTVQVVAIEPFRYSLGSELFDLHVWGGEAVFE